MQELSDAQLLREYAADGSEPAFREIVTRHTDLVYSAALRQVESSDLACDVAQSVFTDLARKARPLVDKLAEGSSLVGWLYRSTRFAVLSQLRDDRRRLARERLAMEQLITNSEAAPDWERIRPVLDEAMADLSDEDREALLLRFFKNYDFRAVGHALGVSDDAAQKRVSRAVERLREFFSKRGVAVGASGLAAVISANAVQAAPAGLVLTISTASIIGATSAVAATTATLTKVIAMTTLQKSLIATAIIVAAGAGIYEARQATQARKDNEALQEKQAALTKQVEALRQERDDATNKLALASVGEPKRNPSEVLKLRGQVGVLQQTLSSISATNVPKSGIAKMMSDPTMREYVRQVQAKMIRERYEPLIKELQLTPERAEKFTQLIGDMWARGTEAASGSGETTMQNVKEAFQNASQGIQEVLGDAGFARYNEFNLEIPARTTLKLLDGRLGENQLSDDQTARLIKVVMAEPFELTHGISGDWDNAYFGSQADFDEHMQKVQESQQRILQQASSFLNSNQLSALAAIQTDSVNTRKTQAAAFTQKH